jgi:hypothetical protein
MRDDRLHRASQGFDSLSLHQRGRTRTGVRKDTGKGRTYNRIRTSASRSGSIRGSGTTGASFRVRYFYVGCIRGSLGAVRPLASRDSAGNRIIDLWLADAGD